MAETTMSDLKSQTLGSVRNDMLEPTKALIEASHLAAGLYTKNFIEANFIIDKEGIDLSKPMKPRMIECEFEVMKNGMLGTANMKVPLLSIAPTPCVAMKAGSITHDYEVKVRTEDTAESSNDAGGEMGVNGKYFGMGFTAKASFSASSSTSKRRESDARAAIHVEQHFEQTPVSEGFLRLQEALLNAAVPA